MRILSAGRDGSIQNICWEWLRAIIYPKNQGDYLPKIYISSSPDSSLIIVGDSYPLQGMDQIWMILRSPILGTPNLLSSGPRSWTWFSVKVLSFIAWHRSSYWRICSITFVLGSLISQVLAMTCHDRFLTPPHIFHNIYIYIHIYIYIFIYS